MEVSAKLLSLPSQHYHAVGSLLNLQMSAYEEKQGLIPLFGITPASFTAVRSVAITGVTQWRESRIINNVIAVIIDTGARFVVTRVDGDVVVVTIPVDQCAKTQWQVTALHPPTCVTTLTLALNMRPVVEITQCNTGSFRRSALGLSSMQFDYQPRYCEENVLRLLAHPEFARLESYAVSMCGDGNAFAIGSAADSDSGVVCWDYHVIAVVKEPTHAQFVVYDFDSRLPWPTSLEQYIHASFTVLGAHEELAVRFRIFTAGLYGREFNSDRAHMRDAAGGWLAPPPPWPATINPTGRITIAAFNDAFSSAPGVLVRSSAALLESFCHSGRAEHP